MTEPGQLPGDLPTPSALDVAPSPTLSVSVTPVLSYALAHNRIAVVHRVDVDNPGPAVAAATLRLQVQDAGGPLGAATDSLLDLPESGTTSLAQPQVWLDPSAMQRVTEQRHGAVRATLLAGGQVIAERDVPVQILAANQWVAIPELLGLEMLAAFVLPHDPAVAELLADAGALLLGRTGSPVLDGYQSGPARVDQVAQALFEAAQARQVRYVTAPASWTDVGQVVRTPAEVLGGRAGTSLDTTLLLAAALERAGLRPLVFVVRGHAFLGYWREEHALAGSAQTEVGDVVNLIDLDLIRLVETTTITVSDPPWTFAASHQPPYSTFLRGDLSEVLGVLDVRQARLDRIAALPVRVVDADGVVQVVPYLPPARAGAAPDQVAADRPGTASPDAAQPRIEQWKNALLDLSLRNRLINFHRRGSIGITVPDGLLGAIEDRIHEPSGVMLLAADQVSTVAAERGVQYGRDLPPDQLAEMFTGRGALFTDVSAASYDTRLRAMAYKARTVIEETGANNLYLALGSLLWKLDDRELRSPLVLVPIRLTTRARQQSYRIELDESGASTPNFCLLEKLRQVHGLHVPGLAQPTEDAFGIDLDGALRAMRVALADAGLPFRVEDSAEIAVLQFAKYRLWKDLADHWSELVANPLVQHLVQAPFDPFVDPAPEPERLDLDDLAASCPIPADASQTAAVGEAAAGRTFVLEGPPGTGKSQTITNLLARAIADGRRVLFVAEKRAALDVVTRRLDAIGLGPFCLDLHDKSSKQSVVRAQITAALDHRVAVDDQGLAAVGEDLRAARGRLSRYTTQLHETNGAGLSFYSARTARLSIGEDTPTLPVPTALLAPAQAPTLSALRRTLTTVGDVAAPAAPRPDHPWAFVDTAAVDPGAVRQAALAMEAAVAALPAAGPLAEAVSAARRPGNLAVLAALIDRSPVPLGVLDETRSARWHQASDAVTAQVAAFAAERHRELDSVTPEAITLPLADLLARATAAAESSWFGRKKRLIAVRDELAVVLRPGIEIEPAAVPELIGALRRLQDTAIGLAGRAAAIPGILVPAGWNPLTEQGRDQLTGQIKWLTWAGAMVDPAGEPAAFMQAVRRWLSAAPPASPADRQAVARLSAAAAALLATCSGTDGVFARWAGELGLVDRWVSTAPARALADPGLASLRRWLALLEALEPLRQAGAGEARAALLAGDVPADDAVRALDAGVAAASAIERRDTTGLAAFDPLAHARQISRFTSSAAEIRQLLTSSIPGQVLDRRSFDPGSGLGQVGELRRELAKQRRGLPVRGLLARYGELITAIMPCMLVSPDSLARFFPPRRGLFDLVVFDEASQIRVADAVGAMGRGNSVVVVGDSKQMPPTSFAELAVSTGEDADGGPQGWAEDDVSGLLPAEDEESILSECVQARVPQRWLSWHYRSQDESLIAFSNRQYYAGGLSSFPAPGSSEPDPGIDGHGVNLVRVDGVFHRSGSAKLLRTNPIEAAAVVDEIIRRFEAAESTPSIGVVTFNIQQRTLIETLLRDSGDQRLIEALDGPGEEGLFVKNLENVQGDERDVILFSTAFSVNSRGQLPLNFGPLNRSGGERRLNVAITRARRQVIVFSSFDPAQLRAEETSSVGIKHLRAYLDLAHLGPGALAPLPAARLLRTTDRHREQIAEALRTRGWSVQTDVGLSEFTIDLVVGDPDNAEGPALAVLLDGPGWAARRTVGDRDGLPIEVLSTLMRWPAVERVWMPEWLTDPESVLDRLSAVLVAAKHAASAATASAADTATANEIAPDVDTASADDSAPADSEPTREELADNEIVPDAGEPTDDNEFVPDDNEPTDDNEIVPDDSEPIDENVANNETAPAGSASADKETADTTPADDETQPTTAGFGAASVETQPFATDVGPADGGSSGQRPGPAHPAHGGRDSPDALPDESLFVPWDPDDLGSRDLLDAIPEAAAVQAVYSGLIAGIEAEGPIHLDRLTRSVAAGFGLHRVVASRHQAILACLPQGVARDPAAPEFAWPLALDPLSWRGFRRTPPGVERPLEHISPRELGNAMVALCGASAGMTADQLWAGTLAVFGFSRRSAAQVSRLTQALELAITQGRLTRRPDGVLAP